MKLALLSLTCASPVLPCGIVHKLRKWALHPGTTTEPFISHDGGVQPQYLLPNATNGGSLEFTFTSGNTRPEPINVIFASGSFPDVPTYPNATLALLHPHGLAQYLRALNYSDECLGLHLSTPAVADLGDGRGSRRLDFLYRENFGKYPDGTCLESVQGGSHFRGWSQMVGEDQPFAWFLAASNELNLTLHHDIVPDGYDLGRDEVVRRALIGGVDPVTGCKYAPAQTWNETGVAAAAAGDVAHYNHDIGTDGIVSVIRAPPPVNCTGLLSSLG